MKFSQVIGNPEAIAKIRELINSHNMPHALLLHGQPGTPKLALARAIAQYMHCTNRIGGEPCGQCDACLQHQSMNHADTYYSFPYVRKGEETTCADFAEEWREFLQHSDVEDYQYWLSLLKNENSQPQILVRESDHIIERMSMAAYSAENKILIMWLPEKMREDTANKLLKIIEEPYPDTNFILVSDNAKAILPTIFSRTQRIELRKPSTQAIAEYIALHYGMDMQQALAIAAPADGNAVQAIASVKLDSENRQFHSTFMDLMRKAYQHNYKSLREWADHVADYKREKARRFLLYATRMVRENFIYNLQVPQLNYLTADEQQFSRKFAPFINERNAESIHNEFTQAEHDIAANGNAKIVLFDMAIKITILLRTK